jgi:TonB family protein
MLCSSLVPRTGPALDRLVLLCLSVVLLTGLRATPVCAGTSTDPLPPTASCEKTFVVVEEQPVPAGGMDGLQARVRYPEEARRSRIEGRVFVQFVVDRQGQVVAPRVIRGVHPALDAEALRVFRATPFTPGRQDGKRVCVQVSLPLSFRLDAPAVGVVDDASRAVQSTTEAATARTEEAAGAVTDAATSATETAAGTAAAVDSASTSVARGVEDTKASVETTKESVGAAASSVKQTFRGLFGRKKGDPPADAAPAVAAGDVLVAKMDGVPLRARPTVEADVLGSLQTADTLIYLGTATDGFLHVQAPAGQGWVNRVLVETE